MLHSGLPRKLATEAALQSVRGTATLLQSKGIHPALIRDDITTPGGISIAGLMAMEARAFRAAGRKKTTNLSVRLFTFWALYPRFCRDNNSLHNLEHNACAFHYSSLRMLGCCSSLWRWATCCAVRVVRGVQSQMRWRPPMNAQ